MRAYLLPFLLIAFLLAGPASIPQTGPHTPERDSSRQERRADASTGAENGVRRLLLSQVDAWNQGKLESFMQGYWQSPDLTFFSGATITKGWEPTLLRYRRRYQAEGKEMGKLEFQLLNIDVLSEKSAVVTGQWRLTMSDGQRPHGLFTLIMKQLPDGWRIVHDHTSSE